MTILILGGTGDAADLARALAGHDVVTSLAGRTDTVPDLPGSVRVGGFGGTEGLAAYLRAEHIHAVIDATHPFAARMSAHAAAACAAVGVPRMMLVRPRWQSRPGDRWIEVGSMEDAARLLPSLGRRAFLTVGVQELAAFAGLTDVHLVVRLIAPRPVGLLDYQIVLGRPPFDAAAEEALMRSHRIDVVVTKDSGGAATEGKIIAARALGLPVVMVRRPPVPEGRTVETVGEAAAWAAAL